MWPACGCWMARTGWGAGHPLPQQSLWPAGHLQLRCCGRGFHSAQVLKLHSMVSFRPLCSCCWGAQFFPRDWQPHSASHSHPLGISSWRSCGGLKLFLWTSLLQSLCHNILVFHMIQVLLPVDQGCVSWAGRCYSSWDCCGGRRSSHLAGGAA